MVLASFHADISIRTAVSLAVRCGARCTAAGRRNPSARDAFGCEEHAEQAHCALELAWANCGCPDHATGGDASGRAAWWAAQDGDPSRLVSFLRKRSASDFHQPAGGGEAPLTQKPHRFLAGPVGRQIAADPVDRALLVAFYEGCINGRFQVGAVSSTTTGWDNDQLVPIDPGSWAENDCGSNDVGDRPVPELLPSGAGEVTIDVADQVRDAAVQAAASRARMARDRQLTTEHREAALGLVEDLRAMSAATCRDRLQQCLNQLDRLARRRFDGVVGMRHRFDGIGRPVPIWTGPEDKFVNDLAALVTRTAQRGPDAVLHAVASRLHQAPGRWADALNDTPIRAELLTAVTNRLPEVGPSKVNIEDSRR